MGLGITVGIFVALVVGSFTRYYVLQTEYTGVMEGLFAGVWAAWPFCHTGAVMRYNFLHPVPRRYKVPLKQAYAKVRQLISDKTYNFGDKWHVTTSDTVARRISASLRFTEEESHLEGNSVSSLHTRKERVQRLVELDVQFKEEPNDVTVIQFDFRPKAEGAAWYACDSIVSQIVNEAEAALGPGTDAGNASDTALPAPPWWLIGVGVLGLLTLWGDIQKVVFK